MKKVLPLIITGCVLMGCSVNPTISSKSELFGTTLPSNIPPSVTTKNKIQDSTPIKSKEIEEPDYQKYVRFLNTNEKVTKFVKEDIDLDGKQEVVIAFGNDTDLNVFVLREEGDSIQNLGRLNNAYSTINFELIKLQSKDKKYIEVFLTNSVSLYGFAIYEIKQNSIDRIVYSASATGTGDDRLIDMDKDGSYDGYIQTRHSYDVLFFNVSRFYEWDGKIFNLNSTKVKFDNYPEKPEEIVSQFLRLSLLDKYKDNSLDIKNKLNEFNISDKILNFVNDEKWRSAFITDSIKFKVKENENTANVEASVEGEKITLDLVKNNEKWQIYNINQSNNGSKK